MKANTADLRRLNIPENVDLSSKRESLTAMIKLHWQKFGYCSILAAFPALLFSNAQKARAEDAKKPEARVAGRTERLFERLNKNCGAPALLKRQSKFRLPRQKGSFDMLAALGGADDCPGRPIPGETIPLRLPIPTPAIRPAPMTR